MGMFGFRKPGAPQNPMGEQPGYPTPGFGSGAPGMVDNPNRVGGLDTSIAADPYAGQRPQGGGGFFDKDGTGSEVLGWARDILAYGPTAPIARMQRARQEEQDEANNAYKIAMAEKAGRDQEPSVVRALRAAGIDPTSPEGRKIIQDNLSRPFVVGSPEGGFTPMGGSYGSPTAAGAPQVTDEASYNAVPSGTQFYDPQGNLRVKP